MLLDPIAATLTKLGKLAIEAVFRTQLQWASNNLVGTVKVKRLNDHLLHLAVFSHFERACTCSSSALCAIGMILRSTSPLLAFNQDDEPQIDGRLHLNITCALRTRLAC